VAALLVRPQVVVTDVSPTMLEIGSERAAARSIPIACRVCPAEELDAPSGSVDLVVCKHFLRLARDAGAVFAEMARVLKPGGRAYVIDFDGEAPWLTGRLLELWVRSTAPRFLREHFAASRRSGLPFSSLPARLAAAGLADTVILRRGVASMVRGVRPSP
jgi:ubiquinone/menaquinone biosynthesis C-methylase UbiE